MYRLGNALGDVRRGPRRPLSAIRTAAQFLSETLYGVELTWRSSLGRRVKIGHLGGIVIAPDVVIGDDCIIRQNVTIGAVSDGAPAPRIGSRVHIGAGAVLIGDIEIGDDVLIGPNTVVTTDVPSGARVLAPPSRIVLGSGETPIASKARGATPEAVLDIVGRTVALDEAVGVDEPLLSSGLIDSLNLVLVIGALEEAFNNVIATEAVDTESFDTARQIADYLTARAA